MNFRPTPIRRGLLHSLTCLPLLALSLPAALHADEVAWVATPSQTGAWLSPSGWEGGAMPLAGDVAVFNNVGAASLSYSMYHALNPTPGRGNIGAVWIRNTRVTNDLTIVSNSSGTDIFNYHGATVDGQENVIIRNDSGKNLVLRADTSPSPFINLTDNRASHIVLTGTGGVAIRSAISGSGSQLILSASSTGIVELGGRGGTYSGGTLLKSGTLSIIADNAAGTGAITSEQGRIEVAANIVFSNLIELQSSSARYQHRFAAGQSYGTLSISSAGDLQASRFSIQSGNASAANVVEAAFTDTSAASNDDDRRTAVLNLTSEVNDLYVLSITGSGRGIVGWFNEGEWENAVNGNATTGSSAITNFNGSFSTSGATLTTDYLGSWGYDSSTQTAWAIVDHGGAFALIPEPGTTAMALTGGLFLLTAALRKAARKER